MASELFSCSDFVERDDRARSVSRSSKPAFIASSDFFSALFPKQDDASPLYNRHQSEICKSRFATMSPSNVKPMENAMEKFVAAYEHYEQSKALALKRGWDGEQDGMLDYVDGPIRVRRAFPSKPLAEAWLKKEIEGGKTLFGCGDIDVMKQMERRCRYCTCRGWKEVQSFLVDDTGITEERDVSDECWDGDE